MRNHIDLVDARNAALVKQEFTVLREVRDELDPFPDPHGVEVADVFQMEVQLGALQARDLFLPEVLIHITRDDVMRRIRSLDEVDL